ncbi:hypothetical protein B0H16DRAFT_1898117 [Mycena metata]|uniref:Uncharacterized protein n=1 Tax=Mycena metata TaxID=1033252 RepID=A0AAD7MGW1_9AGAR|nr:hypothetical protein B0H16DRAFT_1898117 [Mycena metata]
MRHFNSLQPAANGATQLLVYAVFQKHKYALSIKLVRGTYHSHETAAHKSQALRMTTTLFIYPDALRLFALIRLIRLIYTPPLPSIRYQGSRRDLCRLGERLGSAGVVSVAVPELPDHIGPTGYMTS